MAVTITSVPTVTLTSLASGTSQTFKVQVLADQPASNATGSVTVGFNGDNATAPLNFTFDTGVIAPTLTADPGDAANIQLAVADPVRVSSSVWEFTVTVTVI